MKAYKKKICCHNYLNLRILIVVGLLLIGCSEQAPTPEQMDRSPFTGVPCAAPCWQDLAIGTSTESDVMEILPRLEFIDPNTIRLHRMSMVGLDYHTFAPGVEISAKYSSSNKQGITLDVVEDTLTGIEIELNYEITLEEAIEYLGNPDYIWFSYLGAETIQCEVSMMWSSRQLVLASQVFKGEDAFVDKCIAVQNTGKTTANLLISEARYKSPAAIQHLQSIVSDKFVEFTGLVEE